MRKLPDIKRGSTTQKQEDLMKDQYELARTFDHYGEEITQMHLSNFEKMLEYSQWKNASSSLLVLHGTNYHSICPEVESWLSPVAVELIDSLKEGTVFYHLCTRNCLPEGVLSSLICQLFKEKPVVLRRGSNLQDIRSHITPAASC